MPVSQSKQYLINWWLMAFMAFLLWYRNKDYDRIISIFTVLVAIINLIQYGVISSMSETEAGKTIYITLWVQVLTLAISTHVYVQETVSSIYLMVMAVISVIFILYGFYNNCKFISNYDGWYNGGNSNILGMWWWIYVLGLIIPVIIIAYYKNANIIILVFYGILISIYVICNCNSNSNWGPLWFLLAAGFPFITWLLLPLCDDFTKICK